MFALLNYSIKAILEPNSENFDRSAGAIRGRSIRICEVIANELEQLPGSQYTENVKSATRRLRDATIPQFVARAEKIFERTSQAEQTPRGEPELNADVDEMIDACALLEESVRDIRRALLMNRNPEDVDSDNEYEEGECCTNTNTENA